ncbi:MAG TPA: class I SAM-dependent methyltransferase [Thermoanaerobaculia bacterium]
MNYRDDLAHIHHAGFSEFAESAAPGLLEMLWQRDIRDGLIVELGCGSGILARELTRAGFEVLGYDASPSMIALARQTAPKARFKAGAFDAVEIPDCNAIVAMGEVFNYGTFDAVERLIANATTNIVIFDIAERGAYPEYDEQRIDGDDWSVIAVKVSDGARLTRTVETFRVVNGEMRRDKEVHTLELYDRDAMKALLHAHDFRVTIRRSYRTRRLPKGHAVYIAERSARA